MPCSQLLLSPNLLFLSEALSTLKLQWTPCSSPNPSGCSYVWAFALDGPSTWNSLPPDNHHSSSLIFLRCLWSNTNFGMSLPLVILDVSAFLLCPGIPSPHHSNFSLTPLMPSDTLYIYLFIMSPSLGYKPMSIRILFCSLLNPCLNNT